MRRIDARCEQVSEQLKRFKLKWHRYEGWYWVGDGPCETLVREIEVVSAQDYDALAERLREAEAALAFYAPSMNWHWRLDDVNNVIGDSDLSVPEGLYYPRGGKRAREYFKKWGGK